MIPWFLDLAEFDAFLAARVDSSVSIPAIGEVPWNAWPDAPKTRRILEAYDFLRAGPFALPGPDEQAVTDLRSALALFAYRITNDPATLETIAGLASQARPRANWTAPNQTVTLVKIYGVRVLGLLAPYRRDPNAGLDLF